MNVISTYLDTMFTPYPQSPRMLEAKAELSAMMEDAYQGLVAKGVSHNEAVGKVITDFGNLDELAPVLGISGEIAPQNVLGAAPISGLPASGLPATSAQAIPGAPGASATPATPQHPPITLQEAQSLAAAQHRTRFRHSIAVALFVIAAIPLIVLPSAAQAGLVPLSQNAAAMVGLLFLLVLVASGVMLIIGLSREFSSFSRLREGNFSRNPVVTGWAEDLVQQNERGRITALQISVMCWVFSPAPVLLFSLIPTESPLQGFWSVVGVAGTLVMVATGLLILLPATWANTVYETLTKSNAHAGSKDDERSLVGVIAAFYWPITTAIFLAWSFIGDAWGQSWIIWPIAGVLFGALAGGIGSIESYREKNQRR